MTDRLKLSLDAQLCFALYAATNAVTRSYRPRLIEIGLTYPQYLVMLTLWQDGSPRPLKHFAARLHLTANSITPLVDYLEEVGFVARERDLDDRRVWLVALTPKGAALEHDAALVQRDVACDTGLSPAALDTMREELRSVVEHMEGKLKSPSSGKTSSSHPEFVLDPTGS